MNVLAEREGKSDAKNKKVLIIPKRWSGREETSKSEDTHGTGRERGRE